MFCSQMTLKNRTLGNVISNAIILDIDSTVLDFDIGISTVRQLY